MGKAKNTQTEAKTKTQTEAICPMQQSVMWKMQAEDAALANPDAHPQAQYKRSEKQFATMARGMQMVADMEDKFGQKVGATGTIGYKDMVAMGFNPKVRHQSFWGTGKHQHGARAVAQQLHGLGLTCTVEKGVKVENGKRSATYEFTLERVKPFGRYAPTN